MIEIATFGAGCFWNVEEEFLKIKGVVKTTVGYLGGDKENPSYEDVCSGKTGHAEVVQVEYDPSIVSYDELIRVFWEIHDPTAFNRQGPDVGSQYRSVIFYHSPQQEKKAKKAKELMQKSGRFHKDIVTQIEAATTFYKAEEYHQKYLRKGKSCSSPPSDSDE